MGVTKNQTAKPQNGNSPNKNKRKRNNKPKQEKKIANDDEKKVAIGDLDKQVNGKAVNKKQENKKLNGKSENPAAASDKSSPKKKARKRNKKAEKKSNDSTLNESTASVDNKAKKQKKREKRNRKLSALNTLKPEEINLEIVNKKIEDLTSKPISKTVKRRLRKLKRLQNMAEGKPLPIKKDVKANDKVSKAGKRRDRREGNVAKEIANQKLQNKIWEEDTKKCEQRLQQKKGKEVVKKPKVMKEEVDEDDDDEDGSDYEVEQMVKADKVTKKLSSNVPMDSEDDDEGEESDEMEVEEDEDEEVEEVEEEESDGDEEIDSDGNVVDDDEEDDDDNEEEQEEGEDEDEEQEEGEDDNDDDDKVVKKQKKDNDKKLNLLNKIQEKKGQKKDANKKQPQQVNEQKAAEKLKKLVGNNARYVVFVGNLPYTVDKDTLKEHFSKVGEIRDVRIVTEKGSNKPKGFAYVELLDQESYQKALSLHHTMIGGRRINVLYTQPGHKKSADAKKEVKSKNFKLHAMRKMGMLAGSVKEGKKRNDRRNKAKAQQAE